MKEIIHGHPVTCTYRTCRKGVTKEHTVEIPWFVIEWLQQWDQWLFCEKASVAYATKLARKALSPVHGKVKAVWIRVGAEEVCEWWKKRKSKTSPSKLLTESQWDRLRMHARRHLEAIHGMSLDHAVRIVGTTLATNRDQLLGLPKIYHVWK